MKLAQLLTILPLALHLAACGEADPPALDEAFPECAGAQGIQTLTDDIVRDTTFCADTDYLLQDVVFVRGNAQLRIQSGTRVSGIPGSALVVTKSGHIEALGTQERPIVFTSSSREPAAMPGDWGGLVLLGSAPIDTPSGVDQVEGIEPTSGYAQYGGSDAEHDCGELSYVRIEYAGTILETDNELNGLTIAGCGSRTSISHVQVHKGLDDGVEIFGGDLDLDHLLITEPGDDGLDLDQGYSGAIQFVHVAMAESVSSDARALEWDGDDTSFYASNFTVEYNKTGDGPDSSGLALRSGAQFTLMNSIFAGFGDQTLYVGGEGATSFESGASVVSHSVFGGCGESTAGCVSGDGRSAAIDAIDDAPSNTWLPTLQLDAEGRPSTAVGTGTNPRVMRGIDSEARWTGAYAPTGTVWTQGWTR